MQNNNSRRRRRGFSLIEIMVVVVIIAIMAGGAIYLFSDKPDKARRARAQSELSDLAKAVGEFYINESYYPDDLSELDSVRGGIRTEDPWGNEYLYEVGEDYFEVRTDAKLQGDESDDLYYHSNEASVIDMTKMEQQ